LLLWARRVGDIVDIDRLLYGWRRSGTGAAANAGSATFAADVILTIIWYSITHSLFHSRLKT